MFIGLIYRLRELGVPVGISEAVTLGQALMLGIHQQTVTGYYHTARSVLVHREAHLDAFDRAFLAEYAGLTDAQVTEQLREWLDEARREAQIPRTSRTRPRPSRSSSGAGCSSSASRSRPRGTRAATIGSAPAAHRRTARRAKAAAG